MVKKSQKNKIKKEYILSFLIVVISVLLIFILKLDKMTSFITLGFGIIFNIIIFEFFIRSNDKN